MPIKLLDIVSAKQDLSCGVKANRRGTVVEMLDQDHVLVEFLGDGGVAEFIEPIATDMLTLEWAAKIDQEQND